MEQLALKMQGVYKSFRETMVLRGIDLEVKKGEIVCLIGPNGAGKTTLLKCISLLEQIDKGKISLNGTIITKANEIRNNEYTNIKEVLRLVRSQIGIVFQNINLWPHKTVLENLIEAPILVRKVPKKEAVELAKHFLNQVDLIDKINDYPHTLSGGQQQRVAIARTLAMQPHVLLLDEITSALDPELTREVLKVIRELAREGRTMIIVTHQLYFAREIAHAVGFLSDGQILEKGSPEIIFSSPKTKRTQDFLSTIINNNWGKSSHE